MKGIQFIIDDQGEKTAVVIDLKQWGQEWETLDISKNKDFNTVVQASSLISGEVYSITSY